MRYIYRRLRAGRIESGQSARRRKTRRHGRGREPLLRSSASEYRFEGSRRSGNRNRLRRPQAGRLSKNADGFVAVTDGDNRNIMAALIAQRLFHIKNIVCSHLRPAARADVPRTRVSRRCARRRSALRSCATALSNAPIEPAWLFRFRQGLLVRGHGPRPLLSGKTVAEVEQAGTYPDRRDPPRGVRLRRVGRTTRCRRATRSTPSSPPQALVEFTTPLLRRSRSCRSRKGRAQAHVRDHRRRRQSRHLPHPRAAQRRTTKSSSSR